MRAGLGKKRKQKAALGRDDKLTFGLCSAGCGHPTVGLSLGSCQYMHRVLKAQGLAVHVVQGGRAGYSLLARSWPPNPAARRPPGSYHRTQMALTKLHSVWVAGVNITRDVVAEAILFTLLPYADSRRNKRRHTAKVCLGMVSCRIVLPWCPGATCNQGRHNQERATDGNGFSCWKHRRDRRTGVRDGGAVLLVASMASSIAPFFLGP
jgi:hypothetical protein